MKRLIVEFLGTFFLVFTVALTGNPLAIASILMAWLYIGAHISGGHYNPLVSLALAIRGRLAWMMVPRYMAAQVLGGVAAYAATAYFAGQIIVPQPAVGVTLVQAFLAEILLSAVFALVVLNVATGQSFKGSNIYGFAIGFTVLALAAIGMPLSGGIFNPAIAAGAGLFSVIKGLPYSVETIGMYIGGGLLGGVVAAYLYDYLGE